MTTKNFLDLLFYKTRANLKTEISRLYLNYLWWVLEPLFGLGVFYMVFGIFMANNTPHFVIFLLIGVTQWQWFASTVLHASSSIYGAAGLMLRVSIPKIFFPLEVILQDSFKHLFVVALLVVLLVFYPLPWTTAWIALPLILLLQGLLIMGVGILFAALVPFFPDLRHIFATAINVMFFVSGIFFDPDQLVLPQHRAMLYLNPMAGILREYRRVIIHGQWPDWLYLVALFCAACVILGMAVLLITKCDRLYPRICQE